MHVELEAIEKSSSCRPKIALERLILSLDEDKARDAAWDALARSVMLKSKPGGLLKPTARQLWPTFGPARKICILHPVPDSTSTKRVAAAGRR